MARELRQKFILSAEDQVTKVLKTLKGQFRELDGDATKSIGGIAATAGAAKLALGGLAVGVGAVFASTRVIASSVREFSAYEQSLVSVKKTSGLTGAALQDFTRTISQLERKIPVTAQSLNKLAAVAAQAGVTGARDLGAFAETFARLEAATDITGEEGILGTARLFNVTDTDLSEIDRFGAAITALGNTSSATEREILHMATFVGQSIARFGVSIQEILGLSTAMKSLGLRAELAGGSISRAFVALENLPQLGGEKAKELAKLMDLPLDEISKSFENDAYSTFITFLTKITEKGKEAGISLQKMGLGGVENLKVIPVLAAQLKLLEEKVNTTNEGYFEQVSLLRESNAAWDTHEGRVKKATNVYKQFLRQLGEESAIRLKPLLEAATEYLNTIQEVRDENDKFANLSTKESIRELERLRVEVERTDKSFEESGKKRSKRPSYLTFPSGANQTLSSGSELDNAGLRNIKNKAQIAKIQRDLNKLDPAELGKLKLQVKIEKQQEKQLEQEKFLIKNSQILFGVKSNIVKKAIEESEELNIQKAAYEDAHKAASGIKQSVIDSQRRRANELIIEEGKAEELTKQTAAAAELEELNENQVALITTQIEKNKELLQQFVKNEQSLIEAGKLDEKQSNDRVLKYKEILGLTKETTKAQEESLKLAERQEKADASRAKSLANQLLSEKQKIEEKINEINALNASAFDGTALTKSEALAAAKRELDEYNAKAKGTFFDAKEAALDAFKTIQDRAKSLRNDFETPLEELTRRITEIREATSAVPDIGLLSPEESARYIEDLTKNFREAALDIETRWDGLTDGMRDALRNLLTGASTDFKTFALQLGADLAAAEIDRLIFGEQGILDDFKSKRFDRELAQTQTTTSLPLKPKIEFDTINADVELWKASLPDDAFSIPLTATLNTVADITQPTEEIDRLKEDSDTLTFDVVISEESVQNFQSKTATLSKDVSPVKSKVLPEKVSDSSSIIETSLFPPLNEEATINAFTIIEDSAITAAKSTSEAFKNSNSSIIDGFDLFGDQTVKIFENIADKIGDILGVIFKDQAGGFNIGGLFGSIFDSIFDPKPDKPSFEGGGFTGLGSRTGGIDGRGGFEAILHPNEQVIDLNRTVRAGDSAESSFTQVLNITPGVSQEMIPQILEAAKAGTLAAQREIHRRGGKRARMHGVV